MNALIRELLLEARAATKEGKWSAPTAERIEELAAELAEERCK